MERSKPSLGDKMEPDEEGKEPEAPQPHQDQEEAIEEVFLQNAEEWIETALRDPASTSSSILHGRVQGAVTFIDQVVHDVQDFDLLGRELLRVAQLLAEFNQGRFGESSSTVLSNLGRAILIRDELSSQDIESIHQTIEWGVAVAQRMLGLLSGSSQTTSDIRNQRLPQLYLASSGMDKANGYMPDIEMKLRAQSFTIARDTSPLRADSTRDPPLSLLVKCLSSDSMLIIMGWEATQEGWPIAELFCALAKQRTTTDNYAILMDAHPGNAYLEVAQRNKLNPTGWMQDIERLFPVKLPVQWFPLTETTVEDHVVFVAQEATKLFPARSILADRLSRKEIVLPLVLCMVAGTIAAGVCGSGNCQNTTTTIDVRNSEAVVSFLNNVTLGDKPIVYPTKENAGSDEQAMVWLIDDDPLQLSMSNPMRLVQRFAMATLAFQWVDSLPTPNAWLSGAHECDWDIGIECTNSSQTITVLDIPVAQLRGTIPRNLGLLTHLTRLDLSSNELGGPLPLDLRRLTKMASFHLHSNALTGTIPTELALMTSLAEVSLYNNALFGANALCNATATIESMVVDCDMVDCSCCSQCCPAVGDVGVLNSNNVPVVACQDGSFPEPTLQPTYRPTLRPTHPPTHRPTPRPSPKPTPRPTGRRLELGQNIRSNIGSRVTSTG